MVEVSVYAEDVLVKVEHMLFLIVAVRLVFRQGDVKFFTLVQPGSGILECIERYAVSADKLERLIIGSLFNEFVRVVVYNIQSVSYCYVFVLVTFHFLTKIFF